MIVQLAAGQGWMAVGGWAVLVQVQGAMLSRETARYGYKRFRRTILPSFQSNRARKLRTANGSGARSISTESSTSLIASP